MKYLLDTNVCIRFLNGRSPAIKEQLTTVAEGDIALCSVVKVELIYGALKSARPDENLQHMGHFMSRFASLPFDDTSAEWYGRIRTNLEKAGQPVGPNDMLIAAIALANNVTLITHNTREFSRIPDLAIADWETPNSA